MIRNKIDIVTELKNIGYTAYKLRKEKIFGERTMQKFRDGGTPSPAELDKICKLLDCQPGDIMEYIPDDEAGE